MKISSRHQATAAALIGVAIGILSFLGFFGIDRALGTDPVYTWPAGDQAQHLAGAYAYLDGRWTFPLFNTDRINYPQGVNIIFTDSAPFAGLVAKIVTSFTGLRFNYLGSWFFVLWVGQAAAGAYLVRQLGLRHPVFYACGAIFALAWPAFLNRHFHIALQSHFLLIFALGFYFKTAKSSFSWRSTVVWGGLLGIAIWTHAYLFLMSYALFAAACCDALRQRTIGLWQAFGMLAGTLMWCIALALIGGYQTVGETGAVGYGSFRLDLLAYIWPHGSAIFRAPLIFSMQSAFEGFNYIGLGGLLAVSAALFFISGQFIRSVLKRHMALIVCVVGMLAFAITNTISIGGYQLAQFQIATDTFPFSTFRASGRFGWLFGYLLVFGCLALVLRMLEARSRNTALVAAVFLAGLQMADGMLLLGGVQSGFQAQAKPLFETAIFASDAVYFEPPIDCISDEPIQKAAIEVLEIAARAGKITNSAHTARTAGLNCSAAPQLHPKGSVTVTIPHSPSAQFYETATQCQKESGLLLCKTK